MEKLITETMLIASEKFQNFGFKKEQIEQLLTSGKRDLEEESEKLKILLDERTPDIEKINQSLHALKGLLYNLGNMEAGDIMADLKNNLDTAKQIEKIKKIL
ncbi:hypothetical protein [Sulfurovum sp. NBC37-1]|uniref:hypothetical protein n=1 Tax=Sulfurovum sp. (strain NBC37-1) TaxID=387093 RepID=UPI000318A2B2|nr:hypothetical protein [Sulfurovum sp. NBC37-1]